MTHLTASRTLFCILFLSLLATESRAQFTPTIPSDTTTYYVTNWIGKTVPTRRPPDSLMIPGRLIMRFRQGALDSLELSVTFENYYHPHLPMGKGNDKPLSGSGLMTQPRRGYPLALRQQLFADRFCLAESTNVVKDTALRNFLISIGGRCLRRLTAASPTDTASITRTGETIGCDHANWLILDLDSTTNPLLAAYFLVKYYATDVISAWPDYSGGRLFGHSPSDSHFGCQKGFQMMNVQQAWNYEVGDTAIIVSVVDASLDYRHVDFGNGDTSTGPGKKFIGHWNYFLASPWTYVDTSDHGTSMAGIIGARTNNLLPSPFLTNSVSGEAGGWGTLVPDSVPQGRGVSMLAQAVGFPFLEAGAFTAAVFEASARSPSSDYGFGVHAINFSGGWTTSGSFDPVHAPVNYAVENGVVFIAAVADAGGDETQSAVHTYPAAFEEPWVISVGGSIPDKSHVNGTPYGYTMDLLGPAGDKLDCSNPYTLNFTTRKLCPTCPDSFASYAGTSAAAANVSGAAALLLSQNTRHFGDSALSLEPEDVQGMLKAGAWRGDADRDTLTSPNTWRSLSGFGFVDIGNTFIMSDSDRMTSSHSGYFLQHRHAAPLPLLDTGSWSSIQTYFLFSPPWGWYNSRTDTMEHRVYALAEDLGHGYDVRKRVLRRSDTLSEYENSKKNPLFAWGRTGAHSRSGWSFASTPNFETGWTGMTNTLGGDSAGFVEGIFVQSNGIITMQTVQYDVFAFNPRTGLVDSALGHFPPDSMVGVNYSVYGRTNSPSGVSQSGSQPTSDSLQLTINRTNSTLNVNYCLSAGSSSSKVYLYDAIGREVIRVMPERSVVGWNSCPIPITSLPSGMYVCCLSSSGTYRAKAFVVTK